jgi:cytoskeletal protein CcmA (bactofilin family)
MRRQETLARILGCRIVTVGLAVVAAGLLAPPGGAWETAAHGTGGYTLPAGKTHEGDLYRFAPSADISGIVNGDLLVFAQNTSVTGEVAGDMFAFSQTVRLYGPIGDSVRIFASELFVSGTIDGELRVFAGRVTIEPEAHITGDVFVNGGQLNVGGKVDGDLNTYAGVIVMSGEIGGNFQGTAGEVQLTGTVGNDAVLTCDTLTVDPEAAIAGDLDYRAREQVELEGTGIVGGEIRFEEKVTEVDAKDKEGWLSPGKIVFWLMRLLASLVVGFVLIALFRRMVPAVQNAVGSDTLPGIGVGFVLTLVLPVTAVIVMLLVVTLPLAVITLLLWLIAVYVAKLPVALWLGQKILRSLGGTDPSPYLGLPIGLLLLYLLFALPFVGWFLWFVAAFLGLGAIFLGVRAHLRENGRQPGSPAPEPPPAVSP